MSLDTGCHEPAGYSTKLLSASADRARKNSSIREFALCENHSQLVDQVDRELMEEGWKSVFVEKPHYQY